MQKATHVVVVTVRVINDFHQLHDIGMIKLLHDHNLFRPTSMRDDDQIVKEWQRNELQSPYVKLFYNKLKHLMKMLNES